MKQRKLFILLITLALMGATAGLLHRLKAAQKLGQPGIKATPIPDTVVMNIDLPERMLDFTSTNVPQDKVVLDYLPKDTSYAQRRYTGVDGLVVNANIILMGTDRSSIHRPEYCLPGQGWRIEKKSEISLPIGGPQPYQMPAMKWVISNVFKTQDDQKKEVRGVYVFWFVADQEQTADNSQRMWWLARDLLCTGVLQRWAYVSYFAICLPEQEEATFERMKQLIVASVPEFQPAPAHNKPAPAVGQ